MKTTKNLLCPLLVVALALVGLSQALSFSVEPFREQCFYEDVTPGVSFNVQFQVLQGGAYDIDFTVTDPVGENLFKADRETEGKFAFAANKEGTYSFCFSNRMSTVTSKLVSFQLDVGEKEDNDGSKLDMLDPVHRSLEELKRGIQTVKDEQKYMRSRERAHRDTSESTNARVLWWSFFEAAMLVAVSVWQIYQLHKFFEVKRHA
ncbi:Transmembrane emp24 domain-containing protein 2 [Balamuthia mandrillaris]